MDPSKLNVDILYEIFAHFVAIDPDGPYILTLVCTEWRDMVVNSPKLWSWIYVDDRIGDWKERASTNAALSKDHPLQFVIHLPFGDVIPSDIWPYLSRISIFIVSMPSVMELKRGYFYIKNFFQSLDGINKIYVHWLHSSSFDVPNELQVTTHEIMESTLSSTPVNLIGNLQILLPGLTPFSQVVSWISRATFLSRLVINASRIDPQNLLTGESSQIKPVTMQFLRILVIVIGFAPKPAIEILRLCRTPNIATIELKGSMVDITDVLGEVGNIICSPSIKLVVSFRSKDRPLLKHLSPMLVSVLIISILANHKLLKEDVQDVEWLIGHFPRQTELKIEIDDNSCDILPHIPNNGRFIEVNYSGICNDRDALYPSSTGDPPIYIDTLRVISSQSGPHSYPAHLIPFASRILLDREISLSDLLLIIDCAPSLQELEIREIGISSNEDIGHILNTLEAKTAVLQHLVFLKATSLITLILVYLNLIPQLQVLALHYRRDRSYEEYYSHFERLVETLLAPDQSSSTRCPNLHTIRAPHYLPWGPLFSLARFATKTLKSSDGFTIQLPLFPSLSILKPLVEILRGEDPVYNPSFPDWISRVKYNALPRQEMMGCYQCHIGGLVCETRNNPTCWHHQFETFSKSLRWFQGAVGLYIINKHTLTSSTKDDIMKLNTSRTQVEKEVI